MELPQTRISKFVDPLLTRIASGVSFIWVALMAVIVINVTARYLFAQGRIEFEELQWHLYSMGFMLTLGYALIANAHIRVDVFHERFAPRMRMWIDFYGIILLVVPFCLVMLWFSWDFFLYSFKIGEISASPGGLPFRWFIKAFLVVGFGLLLLASLSRLSRLWVGLLERGT
ncbi:MAG: TRAP transporter small permease subunit [Gammaproteobacteria bacterium]|nr:TRAP transporter small permease subunit [Gammaproteobacteria bacterium]